MFSTCPPWGAGHCKFTVGKDTAGPHSHGGAGRGRQWQHVRGLSGGLQRKNPSTGPGQVNETKSHLGSTYICFQEKYMGSALSGRSLIQVVSPLRCKLCCLIDRIGGEKLKCDFYFFEEIGLWLYFFLLQILPTVTIFPMQLQE